MAKGDEPKTEKGAEEELREEIKKVEEEVKEKEAQQKAAQKSEAKEKPKEEKKSAKKKTISISSKLKGFGSSLKGLGGSLTGAGSKEIPNIVSIAFILVPVAALDYFIKSLMGYEVITSLIISTITLFVFFMVLKNKVPFIIYAIDVSCMIILNQLPAIKIFSALIFIKMFIWLAFAILSMLYEFIEYVNIGKKIPMSAEIALFVFLIIILFLTMPVFSKFYTNQVGLHREQYEVALEQVEEVKEKVSEQYEVSKSWWGRWWEAIPYLLSGDIENYNRVLNPPPEDAISGEIDKSIKGYTKVEFQKPIQFPKAVQKDFFTAIPMDINIESPKKQINLEFSCSFRKLGEYNEIPGKIEPEKTEDIMGSTKKTILCYPPNLGKDFEQGTYEVIYEAEIKNIETESILTRLFVGSETTESDKARIVSLHGLSLQEPSKSGDEFAVFSFGIGNPTDNPFIEGRKQPIIGNIENKEEGQITSVDSIKINLIDGVSADAKECTALFTYQENQLILSGDPRLKNLDLKKGERMFLLGCNLDIYSSLLKKEDYLKRSFSSTIVYSYKIRTEEKIYVQKGYES